MPCLGIAMKPLQGNRMTGVEINFCVYDVLKAFDLYEKVFNAKIVEKTANKRGMNEVVFTILGSRFHMLDESPENGLNAPKEEHPTTVWINIILEKIQPVYDKALEFGFTLVFDLQEVTEYHIKRFMVKDPFGMVWLVHGN